MFVCKYFKFRKSYSVVLSLMGGRGEVKGLPSLRFTNMSRFLILTDDDYIIKST